MIRIVIPSITEIRVSMNVLKTLVLSEIVEIGLFRIVKREVLRTSSDRFSRVCEDNACGFCIMRIVVSCVINIVV